MHVCIGGGYTGALAFASAEGELFVYKCGGYKEGGALDDFLIRLDASGAVKQQIALPKPLAWRAERAGETAAFAMFGQIFILRDGEISLLTQYKAEMKSSTPIFCIALSADGSRLALHCKQNEIKILSTTTLNASCGEILNEIKGDFGIFDKICFLADGSVLGKERYAGKLVYLDAASGERLKVRMAARRMRRGGRALR